MNRKRGNANRLSLVQAVEILGKYNSVDEASDAFAAIDYYLQHEEEKTLRAIESAFGNPNPRVFDDVMRSLLMGKRSNLPDDEILPFLEYPIEYVRRVAAASLKRITPANTTALLNALRKETSELAVEWFLEILAVHWDHYLQRGETEWVEKIGGVVADTAQIVVRARPLFGVCFLRFINPPLAFSLAREAINNGISVESLTSALWMFWDAPGINNQEVLDLLDRVSEMYGKRVSRSVATCNELIIKKGAGEVNDLDEWLKQIREYSSAGRLLAKNSDETTVRK